MNLNEKTKYKKDETPSQLRKKLKKSEAGKTQWKDKNREKLEETKILKMRMKEARESRDHWRKENLEKISSNEILQEKLLRAEEELIHAKITNMNLEKQIEKLKKKSPQEPNKLIDGEKTKRSLYTTYLKWLVVYIIICTMAPFRTVEKIFKVQMSCELFIAKTMPSDTSCRRWLNQVGYYKLRRPKEKADDWIYIIDNSIRSESRKVCLILGVRASQLKQGKSLSLQDVEPIELRIINSNCEVEEIIKDAINKTGVPIQICSDLGPDIMPSIKKVMALHPKIKHIPDIMHKVGNMLKKKLDKDSRWNAFVSNTNKANNTLKQSRLSFMCPPNFRGKSRFLNCSNVVDWADCSIRMLKNIKKTNSNWEEMHRKLGWQIDNKEDIALFKELFYLADIGKEVIRKLNIEKHSASIAKELLKKAAKHEEGKEFAREIVSFIEKQCAKVEENKLMIGVSEIIESAFSKLKILDRESGKSGFTSSTIGLTACFGNSDFNSIEKAFTQCTYKDVLDWSKDNLGETFQTKRKQFFKFTKKENLGLKIELLYERKVKAA
jgi:hypothetical protein